MANCQHHVTCEFAKILKYVCKILRMRYESIKGAERRGAAPGAAGPVTPITCPLIGGGVEGAPPPW